ncbi:hypothetical protein EON64_12330, partial [archaeon]
MFYLPQDLLVDLLLTHLHVQDLQTLYSTVSRCKSNDREYFAQLLSAPEFVVRNVNKGLKFSTLCFVLQRGVKISNLTLLSDPRYTKHEHILTTSGSALRTCLQHLDTLCLDLAHHVSRSLCTYVLHEVAQARLSENKRAFAIRCPHNPPQYGKLSGEEGEGSIVPSSPLRHVRIRN